MSARVEDGQQRGLGEGTVAWVREQEELSCCPSLSMLLPHPLTALLICNSWDEKSSPTGQGMGQQKDWGYCRSK